MVEIIRAGVAKNRIGPDQRRSGFRFTVGPSQYPFATARYLSGQFSCPIRFRLRRGAWDRLWWASLLSPLPFKSRRPAEHEREPSERIRRETQEAIAIGSDAPELLVARNRPDRDAWRRQNESFSEPHVHLHGLCVWSDVEERLPVRSPDWGGAACRGHTCRATRTRQGTHEDFRSAGLVRDVDDVLPVRRDVQERDCSRRREQRLRFAIQKRERDDFTAGRPLSTEYEHNRSPVGKPVGPVHSLRLGAE